MNKFIVIAGFQGVWFISVLSAASGLFWLGPFSVICWVLIYARMSGNMKRELLLCLAAGFIGLCMDSLLVWSGAFIPKGISSALYMSPAWMIGLWLNFGTSLNSLFHWLKGRYILAALFGLLGGPAAYYSGVSLGAAVISQPYHESLFMIGIAWGISMPLLIWLSKRIH